MDIVERLREKAERKSPNLYMKQQRIETEAADEIKRLQEELAVVKESLPTCKRSLQLADSLTEFMEWAEALAIVGSVTPEAWDLLNKITRKAEKRLFEVKE